MFRRPRLCNTKLHSSEAIYIRMAELFKCFVLQRIELNAGGHNAGTWRVQRFTCSQRLPESHVTQP